jgi:hypothetical protein
MKTMRGKLSGESGLCDHPAGQSTRILWFDSPASRNRVVTEKVKPVVPATLSGMTLF